MQAQIVKWGNSQGIRLPKSICKQLDLHINDVCSIKTQDHRIIIEKSFQHKTLEERAQAYGNKLGPYTEFDWGEPRGREIW